MSSRRLVFAGLCGCMLSLCYACGGSSNGPDLRSTSAASATTSASDGAGGGVVPPLDLGNEQLRASLADASEAERSVLEDGSLTFAEYERVVLTAVQCLEDRGFTIVHYSNPPQGTLPLTQIDLSGAQPGIDITPRGRILYSAQRPQGSDPGADGQAFAACKSVGEVVEFLWLEHIKPSEREMQALREGVADCIRATGRPVPESPTPEDLLRLAFPPDGDPLSGSIPDWYQACDRAAAEEFGF